MSQSDKSTLPTVLITGCSAGGIGSALAEEFHHRGLHVFATARSLSKMSHLESLINITLLELDVTSQESINAALEFVAAKTGGKLDYLVNNSGQSMVMPALDTDLDQAKKLFDVNFWGVVTVTQAFSPLVIASKGTIVNIASLAAIFYTPWMVFYNASKAAIKSYGETLRLEMAPLGVKVLTVMTGTVGTNIGTNSPEANLPQNSLYHGAAKEIKDLRTGASVGPGMSSSVYAKRVVSDVLGDKSGLTWRGKMSSLGRTITSIFPTWLIDRSLLAGRGTEHIGLNA